MTDSPDIEPASDAPEDDDLEELRHHVSADSDEGSVLPVGVPEPALEMPDPAPEGESDFFGGPPDASPTLIAGSVGSDDSAPVAASELQQAYDCLEIRTPIEEFRTFAKARLETLVRLGEADRAEVTSAALDLGLSALREVMGAVRKGGRQ